MNVYDIIYVMELYVINENEIVLYYINSYTRFVAMYLYSKNKIKTSAPGTADNTFDLEKDVFA